MVLTNGHVRLREFIDRWNNKHPNIRFTWDCTAEGDPVIRDLKIIIDFNNMLVYELFQKPSESNVSLKSESCPPPPPPNKYKQETSCRNTHSGLRTVMIPYYVSPSTLYSHSGSAKDAVNGTSSLVDKTVLSLLLSLPVFTQIKVTALTPGTELQQSMADFVMPPPMANSHQETFRFQFERENRRHPRGSENQTEKNELAQMGIEPMAFELALRRSNH